MKPCPYGKKCLHMITPDQVLSAVDQLWSGPVPLAGGHCCDMRRGPGLSHRGNYERPGRRRRHRPDGG